jgi:hypothetical protein
MASDFTKNAPTHVAKYFRASMIVTNAEANGPGRRELSDNTYGKNGQKYRV